MNKLKNGLTKRVMAVILSGAMMMSNAIWSDMTALAAEPELQTEVTEEIEEVLETQEEETLTEKTLTEETEEPETTEQKSVKEEEAEKTEASSNETVTVMEEAEEPGTEETTETGSGDEEESATECSGEEEMLQAAPVSIIESNGWHESAYVKWNPVSGADSYNVYYKKDGTDKYTKIDDQLIRGYKDYFIADVLGLTKGDYILKVVPVADGTEIAGAEVETEKLSVDNYVREGFAFSPKSPYEYTTGAYNKDGTLRSDADVVYVTNANKNTVTVNGNTALGVGLTEILSQREKSKSEKPIAIRLLGKVEMPKDTENYMIAVENTKNVTIEGVGDDAVLHGCGFTTKRACNLEFRNFAIMWYGGGGDGDSLSLDTDNKNVWIHNMDFFYGIGGEKDQAKGDGSVDLKSASDYITVSYCHFWDSGKALVSGGPNEAKNPDVEKYKIYTNYHHNWFDHSDSRHPRCVTGSTHVYNNYYDGVAKYGPGAAVKASVFVENNYFRNCPRPMLIATQGSDAWSSEKNTYTDKGTLSGQDGGMIKECGNVIIGAKRFYTYQNTPDEGHFDAYHVDDRNEKVPETVKALKGGAVYNNFDTDPSIMYDYNVETAEQAKETVMKEAGRRNGGDFKYTFDNAVQDSNSDVIPELQNAVKNYESKLISVQGMTGDPNEGKDPESKPDPDKPDPDKPDPDKPDPDNPGDNNTPTNDWNADQAIPNWLDIPDTCTKGTISSSHTVFRDTDSSISSQKNRYVVPKGSAITINLSSASVVKVYIAANNNGDGKGTVTAKLDGADVGTYSLPRRDNAAAKPFVIETTKGGTLSLTNSYESLLFKITISSDSEDPDDPVVKEKYDVTLKITNTTAETAELTVGENTIAVSANDTKEETVKLEAGEYSVAVSGTKLKADPSSITVEGGQTIEITLEEISGNVIVTDKDGGYLGSYEKISDALAADSTVTGSVISVMPGTYKETFDVSKSVTLKKAQDSEGEVIIYSPGGTYGGSMDGIVRVSASNVTFKDLTLLNNTQSAYKDIPAASTAENTAAALIADGDNSVYENCKFISVQDTLVTKGYSTSNKTLLKQTYNNCIFYGATDFICGSCDVTFNDCEFRFFTGALNKKVDAYIFAPDTDAKWVVNGGKIVKDDICIAQNLFYARAWEAHSSDTQTLDIFGAENNLQMATVKGLMGFGSSTGGGKPHHNIHEFQFNVYEGADKNSPLIATSDILSVDVFEINRTTPVIEFKNNSSASLIVGNFGEGLSEKFIQNVVPDVVEIGFVSEANANEASISDTNTVKVTGVYKNLKSNGDAAYSLEASLEAQKGFLGAAVLNGVDGEKTVKLVPYVKYDPTTDSDKAGADEDEDGKAIPVDKKCIYKFGTPVAVTLKGNGGEGNPTTPAEGFRAYETDGVFGETLPAGIGTNVCSNVVTADDEAVAAPTVTYKGEAVIDNALRVEKDADAKLILSTTTSGAVMKYRFGEESAQEVVNGEVTIPTGAEKTLTFKTWAEKGGKSSDELTITITVFDPNVVYTVKLVKGEGQLPAGMQEETLNAEGVSLTLDDCIPPQGKKFVGWKIGTGEPFKGTYTINPSDADENKVITITAVYDDADKVYHTVKLKLDGGELVDGGKLERVLEDKTEFNPGACRKDGYTFTGWVDENGNMVTMPCILEADMTLTATWKRDDDATNQADIVIIGLAESYEYTGVKITPDFDVMDYDRDEDGSDGTLLMPGIDYTVKYTDNVKVSEPDKPATVTVIGKGNYTGNTVTATFIIKAAELPTNVTEEDMADLKGAKLNLVDKTVTYTGTAQYPSFSLTIQGEEKTYVYNAADKVYKTESVNGEPAIPIPAKVAVSNNINKGTATILVTGATGSNGKPTTVKKTFKILPVDISKSTVTVSASSTKDDEPVTAEYGVKGAVPKKIYVKVENKLLVCGKDYTVKYSSNKAVGVPGKIVITGKGNYSKAYKEATFSVEPLSFAEKKVEALAVYEGMKVGSIKEKAAAVTDGAGNSLKSSQYTLNVEAIRPAGENGQPTVLEAADKLEAGDQVRVTATVKDTTNLVGGTTTTEEVFTVGRNIAKAKFVVTPKAYEGKAIELTTGDLTATYKNKGKEDTLAMFDDTTGEGSYKIVSYANNTNKGTATAVIVGKGEYSGTKTIKFKIVEKPMKQQIVTVEPKNNIINWFKSFANYQNGEIIPIK